MSNQKGAKAERLPLLPLRGLVAYPDTLLKIDVGREKSIAAVEKALENGARIVVSAQIDPSVEEPQTDDVYDVGAIVIIRQAMRLPDSTVRLLVEGEARVRIAYVFDEENMQKAEVRPSPFSDEAASLESMALTHSVKDLFERYAREKGDLGSELVQSISGEDNPGKLCSLIAMNILTSLSEKQELLEEESTCQRLTRLCELLVREIQLAQLEQVIRERVQKELDQHQKEYYLHEQLNVIHDELGDGELSERDSFAKRLETSKMNDEARAQVTRELKRLDTIPPGTPEIAVSHSYIECMLELPWGEYTKDNLDIKKARRILDQDHFGLEDVKERVLEFLSVGAVKGSLRGPILCLVGPPGVGKTSVAKSVAKALGRKFVRMSLGGLRDEAEIRGHRRTYIGAIPGRIISCIRQCGAMNPVFLLDEIDKMGADSRGDPASALLEALDPEQNATFSDHYLEAPFDLSQVLFLTTANQASAIPEPLMDRMETIDISGYTQNEKTEIAVRHLWPKQLDLHGLDKAKLRISRKALEAVIDGYTRESGVRQLEQKLGKICRRACMKLAEGEETELSVTPKNLEDYLGVRKYLPEDAEYAPMTGAVNGLAWTAYGGDTLTIEASAVPGKGVVALTGQLGDVMKESAQTAHSYLRKKAPELGLIPDYFEKHDFHVHVPEGATPKDGPSAGVALYLALASAATGRKIRRDTAITGEITLLGRVLPVGGIKEKLLAAHRMGIRRILLPKANARDLEKLPDNIRAQLDITLLQTADQALELALLPDEGGKS